MFRGPRPRSGSRIVAVLLVATASVACASPAQDPAPWDRAVAGSVGVTEWESNGTPSSPFGPDGFAWETPQQLMEAMAASLGRRGTEIEHAVVPGEDPDLVFGWVRITNPAEDATVAGDLRLRIERMDGSWAATLVEIRRHCRFEREGTACLERGGPAPVETAPPEESASPSDAASD